MQMTCDDNGGPCWPAPGLAERLGGASAASRRPESLGAGANCDQCAVCMCNRRLGAAATTTTGASNEICSFLKNQTHHLLCEMVPRSRIRFGSS